jgi:transposase
LGVSAASVQDRQGALLLLPQVEPMGERWKRLFADSAYAGQPEDVFAYFAECDLQIVRKRAAQKGFVVHPKRWSVERTFAWFVKNRRLRLDYECQPQSSQAMIRWAMIARMLRLLKPT